MTMDESPGARQDAYACERCKRKLVDGDTAYEVDMDRILVEGDTVRQGCVSVLICDDCSEIEP